MTSSAARDGLDQDVLRAALERVDGVLERRLARLDEQDRGAEGVGVALDALEQAGARLRVDDGDVGLPAPAAIDGVTGVVALRHIVARLGQYALETASLARPPMGYDYTHC